MSARPGYLAIVTGRLGRDPELKTLAGGKRVTKVSVAVDYKVRGREEKHTEWVPLTAWDDLAEELAAKRKGEPITVHGRRTYDVWTGRDGVTRESYGVTVESLGETGARAPKREDAPSPSSADDDLPF